MAETTIAESLCRFINEAFLADGSRIDRQTPLLELHILDSAAVFDVVDFVRREFGVAIPVSDIHPEHFASVASMERLVRRLAPVENVA